MDRLKGWTNSSTQTGKQPPPPNFPSYPQPAPKARCRPPPLRTVGTYDDDEFFNNVALNMLSRYQGLGLSPLEAICCTLVTPQSRLSFFDALTSRLGRPSHIISPTTQGLLQDTKRVFWHDLQQLALQQQQQQQQQPILSSSGPFQYHHHQGRHPPSHHPVAPKHHYQQQQPGKWCSSNNSSSSSGSGNSHSHSSSAKKKNRRFFPDDMFLRRRSNKVVNIDWKLTETVQQVQNLQLDDDSTDRPSLYQPPPRIE